jgi:hypothetical protein
MVQNAISTLRVRSTGDSDARERIACTSTTGRGLREAPAAVKAGTRLGGGRARLRRRSPCGRAIAADLAYEGFAQSEIGGSRRRRAAFEARVDADLALGRHAEIVPELGRRRCRALANAYMRS